MPTWYVNATATGAGDGTSEADAYTTIDAAFNEVSLAAGDTIYVKASATYDETADVVTGGAYQNYILVEGYTTTPGDGGQVTWTQSVSGSCLTDTIATGHMKFENFIFDGSANNHNVNVASRYTWVNCQFINAAFGGLLGSANHTFYRCVFANNSSYGMIMNGVGNTALGCIFNGNGTADIYSNTNVSLQLHRCLFYDGPVNYNVFVTADDVAITCCTFDGSGSTIRALDLNGFPAICADNIFHDYTYALDYNEGSDMRGFTRPLTNNLFSSVTTKYSNVTTERTNISNINLGGSDIIEAADFTDEAGGDYTLAATSPAIDAGTMPGNFE